MKSKFAALFWLASAVSCGGISDNSTGSKTNWLAPCTYDVDCEGLPDALCEAHQCTKGCTQDEDCMQLGSGIACGEGLCIPYDPIETVDAGNESSSTESPGSTEVQTGTVSETATPELPDETASEPGEEGSDPDVQGDAADASVSDLGSESSAENTGAADAGMPQSATESTTESSGGMEPLEDNSCEPSTLDPNQGNLPPAEAECAAIGTALKQGHDAALVGATLDIEPLVGTWTAGTGPQRIELVLDVAGQGTLRFGEASSFPTPTSADDAFLTEIGEAEAGEVFGLSYLNPQPGFGYSVIAEFGQGSEMSFHILTVQAWDPWCALQEPVYSPYAPVCYACMEVADLYSLYGCGDDAGCYASDLDPDPEKRVHCGRMEVCAMPYNNACACSADECFANVEMSGQLNFYPYEVQLDPVDTSVLRLRSLSELEEKTTYYLTQQSPDAG